MGSYMVGVAVVYSLGTWLHTREDECNDWNKLTRAGSHLTSESGS